jgi:DNA-binding MarR family transcriptional regulator
MGDPPTIDTSDAMHAAAFRQTLRSFLRTSEQIARASGLTPTRHLLLLMIKGAPDGSERATVTELADRLQLAQSSVTELVSRAEQAGLIERERSEVDARVAHLRLTDEGERRFALAFRSLAAERQHLRKMLAALERTEGSGRKSSSSPSGAADSADGSRPRG